MPNKITSPIEEAFILAGSYDRDFSADEVHFSQDQIQSDMSDIANLLEPLMVEKTLQEKRRVFMEFFRSDEFNEALSADDCVEVFSTCMKGSSDFTPELLNQIFDDYSVNLQITPTDN